MFTAGLRNFSCVKTFNGIVLIVINASTRLSTRTVLYNAILCSMSTRTVLYNSAILCSIPYDCTMIFYNVMHLFI